MEKIYATPAAGMRCRKQDGSVLAESGEAVERNAFWLRRERDGDVTLSAVTPDLQEPSNTAAIKSKK